MTIRSKLIITNIVVFGLILAAVAVAVYVQTRESEIAKLDSNISSFAASFTTEFDDQWEDGEFPESSEIEALPDSLLPGIRVELLDSTGRSIFRRGEVPPVLKGLIRQTLSDKTTFRDIEIHDEWFRQCLWPIEVDEHTAFALVLVAPAENIEDRLGALMAILIVSFIAALLISVLAVYFVTGRAFQPVTNMVYAAERISGSTLERRLEVPLADNEVHRLARALNSMMQRIEDAFKSQRQFVADASHELRTPLTVVYGELEYLKRQTENPNMNKNLDAALLEIDRLSHLVDQLLLLARIDARKLPIERKPVRLDELLAESVRVQQANASKRNVRILLHIDEILEIPGDAVHLKRVFINIIDNAVKYSPGGGEIDINLKRKDIFAIVSISDRGPGIDESETGKVFSRFYRSPRARQMGEGSGLGLAIARELVEAHGGKIELEAPESGGTGVRIRLPLENSTA